MSEEARQTEDGKDALERRAWPRERQWRAVGVAAVALVAVVALAWIGLRLFGRHEAPAAGPATPAGTFRPTEQQLKTFTIEPVAVHAFVGEELTEGKIAVNADRATPVYSPYSGRVTRVIAGLGDTVAAGAPLAGVAASEFVQAQGDLAAAAAQVKLARSNETRKHALYDAEGGSLQDWQQAQADLSTAVAAQQAVRNRLRILGKSDADIDALEAAAAIQPVAMLTAPLAGVIVDRQIGPGQYLQSGAATPLFTIADPSSVWLIANVRESEASRVKRGQPVEVRVLAYPDRIFKAHLTYVAAIVDPVTHRIAVRAEIDNRDGLLKPEMFANFRIITAAATQSPAVPAAALVYEGEAAHIWVVQDDGLISYRAVRTGRSDGNLVEVLEGLKGGEKIVVKGGLFIDQVAAPTAS